MFRRRDDSLSQVTQPLPTEKVTSVLGQGLTWKGQVSGSGGVRIEGSFDGEISLRGLLVVGESGRVTCPHLRARVVIIAGAVRGDITAEKVEIRSTGRVWGNVVTAAFMTEEGAFLRGQIRMEERVDISAVLAPEPAEQPPAVEPPAPPADHEASGASTQPVHSSPAGKLVESPE